MGVQNVGVLLSAAVRPNNTDDLIATAYSSEIKGGHHSVATLADRNAIIIQRKELGMLCTIHSDGANNGTYQLTTLPNTWVIFNPNPSDTEDTSWLPAVIDKISTPPFVANVGDRYMIGVSASGLFTGEEDKIAQLTAVGWTFSTPEDGDHVVLKSEDNGIWRYINTYPSGRWEKQLVGGIAIKNYVANETIEVPENYQYLIYGDLTIDNGGGIINYGEVVTINGNLIINGSGTFSNYGTYLSPAISLKKYSVDVTTVANTPLLVTHNLFSTDIVCVMYVDNSPVEFDMTIIDNVSIVINTTTGVSGRINIMS